MAEDQEFVLPPLEERPLVTFALFAYNQEKYIREAVEGAFAQTYEPLEIIISDDHSTDSTFQIIKETIDQYEGDHQIIARQNTVNRGLNSHINDVINMASGQFIVMAAGDDISEPHRTSFLAAIWIKNNKANVAIQSGWVTIDENGENIKTNPSRLIGTITGIEKYLSASENIIHGATGAYSIELFKKYTQLPVGKSSEDKILSFRALLEEGIIGTTAQLVRYRVHANSLTAYILPFSEHARWISRLDTEISIYETHLIDLQTKNRTAVPREILASLRRSLRKARLNRIIFSIPRLGPLIYCLLNPNLGPLTNRLAYFLKASQRESSIIFKVASYSRKKYTALVHKMSRTLD